MLKSDRIYLKLIDHDDLEFYKKLYSDSELMQYIMPLPDKQKTLKSFNLVLKRSAHKKKRLYVIKLNKNHQSIGIIGLSWNYETEAELGTVIIQEKQRNGYAQEARKLLLMNAFEKLNVHKIVGYTDVKNKAINELNQKLGSIKDSKVYNKKRKRWEFKWIILYKNFIKFN